MDITRTLTAGAVGLALLVGAAGCGKVAEEAGERIAEEAVENNSGCQDVNIESGADGGSFSGTCDGTEIDADAGGDVSIEDESGDYSIDSNADGEVSYPEGWPEDLTVVEGLDVLVSTSDSATGAYVTGSLDGDLAAVADQIRADLEATGFTIDQDTTSDKGDGHMGTFLVASRESHTATVSINETPNDPQGSIGVTYLLAPPAAG